MYVHYSFVLMTTRAAVMILMSCRLFRFGRKFVPTVFRTKIILLPFMIGVQGHFGINGHTTNRVLFLALGRK